MPLEFIPVSQEEEKTITEKAIHFAFLMSPKQAYILILIIAFPG